MVHFHKKHLHTAIRVAFGMSLTISGVALADETSADAHVVLDEEVVKFEDLNRYAVPETDGSTGLLLTNRETPQMVSILNQARIKDQNLKTMKEVLDNTTGINVGNIDGGRLTFSSRGFSIGQFSADGADMDFNAQMSVGETLVGTDIYEKIEVTHGATGLITGSGEPSARVNMVRKKATYTSPTGEISANANRFGNYGASFDYATGLTKNGKVRGRVVLSHQDGETFIDREERGRTSYYGTVQADLTDRTLLDVGAVYRENKQHSVMWGGLPTWYSNGTQTDWDVSFNNSVDWVRWDNKTKEYFANLQHHFNNDWELNLKTYHMDTEGDPKLFYHGYTAIDATTGLPTNASSQIYTYTLYHAKNSTKQTYYAADLKGRFRLFDKEHKATLGVSRHTDKRTAYSNSMGNTASDIQSLYTWNGSYAEPDWSTIPLSETPNASVKSTEKSIYGAVQLKLAEPLTLVLGSRFSDYNKSGVQWGSNVSSKAEDAWTPYAGLIYDINDNQSVYASYTSIFQPQTRRDASGAYLDPIEGNTYELGFKSSSSDGKLQGSVTLFSIQQDNVASAVLGSCTTSGYACVQGTENNAEASKEIAYTTTDGNTSRGVEVEVSGKLSKNWQAMMSFTQFDAKDNTGARINTTSSNRMMKLWTIYDVSRYVDGLSIGGGFNWYGERYAYLTNPATSIRQKYGQDNIFLVNLMARYNVTKNLDFQLNVTNLLDEKYFSGSGFNQLTYGEPLNVSGSVTYRF